MSESVEYVRRAYDHTVDWYKNADTKAEIIFALNGAFLAFVTGSIFMNQVELAKILENITGLTKILLIAMSVSLILSIIFAIICLWSRIPLRPSAKASFLEKKEVNDKDVETYTPELTWFFQHISWLDEKLLFEFLKSADKDFEFTALSANLYTLSVHVTAKHKWIDRSLVCFGSTLILFFLFGISYIGNASIP